MTASRHAGRPRGPLGPETLHASAVSHHGRGCLIVGPAGSGKTTLALEMMAFGASLVADDRVEVHAPDGDHVRPRLSAPPTLAGLIEIRGVGILRVAGTAAPAPLWIAANLATAATERMPLPSHIEIGGTRIPEIPCRNRPAAAATLMAILAAGHHPDPELGTADRPS
jgi:HPr kinase/phosphorylase